MRHRLTVIVFLVMLGLFCAEPSAWAQVLLTAIPGSDPQIGDNILFTGALLAVSPLTQTTLTLTFPGGVTTTAGGVQIMFASGVFSTISQPSVQGNVINVTLPGIAGNNDMSGSFRIVGFQLPGCGPISLGLSSFANNYLLSNNVIAQPAPLVITSVNIARGIVNIHGTGNFCSPSVYLGGQKLTGVVPLPAGGVSAILPARIASGSYLLNVSRFPGDSNTAWVFVGTSAATPPNKQ